MSFGFSLYYETTALGNKGEDSAVDQGTGGVGLKPGQELSTAHFMSPCRLQNIIELFGF